MRFAAFLRFASLSHMSEALVAGTIYSPRGRASQCMIGPLSLTRPRLITLNFSLMVVRRPGTRPPTTVLNAEIFTFLAYQTYSVAREKTTKATEKPPDTSEDEETSEDNMDNLKRTLGDAGTFLTRAVQVFSPFISFTFAKCQM